MWTNALTGQRLDATELQQLRTRAHHLYEVNPHIFEDEREALVALGAEPPAFVPPIGPTTALPLLAA